MMEIKCILVVLLINSVDTRRRLRTILDRVDAMELPKESPIQGVDLHIVPSNNSLFQGEFTLLRELVNSKLKIVVEIVRCSVREAPDTCEYLINLKQPNVCMTLNAENMAWSDLVDAFSPKLRCPFKKGKYVTNNATFDGNKWNIFPLEKYFFKSVFKFYEDDVLFLGFYFDDHFVRIL